MELLPRRRRAGLGPACPGCRHPPLRIRNYIAEIGGKTFFFHFENILFASGRRTTFLCYEVKRREGQHTVPLYSGIFTNQGYKWEGLHAELCFLHWFHDHLALFPSVCYQVTWYLSWSPCPACAELVAAFLAAHPNVSLTIFASRLYYFWHPGYQEGLRRLCAAGAQVAAMSGQDFEYCWEKFVRNRGRPFKPWKNLASNYCFQYDRLEQILRKLSMEEFLIQFNNQPRVPPPYHHRVTYLCYELKLNGLTLAKDCLKNEEGLHAEIRFIEQLSRMQLDAAQRYQLTCYVSWSPCPECAGRLAAFARGRPFVRLRVLAARLYFHWLRAFQDGLQRLCRARVPVGVMGLREFTACWDSFVRPEQERFERVRWNNLERHSDRIERRLGRIWKSWGVEHLIADLEEQWL